MNYKYKYKYTAIKLIFQTQENRFPMTNKVASLNFKREIVKRFLCTLFI